MNILLVGNGKWGKNYISTLKDFSEVNLTVATRQNWKQLIDNNPNGVIIATPPDSHIEIANYALQKDVPIMIEKPLVLSLDEVKKLECFTTPILVNYIHLFSDAYQKIKKIVEPEKITNITSAGYNCGPIRNYSSLWDYGVHDMSLILDLVGDVPVNVQAFNLKNDGNGRTLNKIQLKFKTFTTNSIIGNGADNSCRTLSINYDGLNISYDDKARPYNHASPLANAIKVFIKAIHGKEDWRLGLNLSIKITKILELCQQFTNNT